jgi:sugar (pentulose or hexulose) kinase
VGNFVLRHESSGFSPIQLVLPAPVGEGALVVQPLLTGNVTWDWALRTLVHADHGEALRRAASIFADELLPPRGLTALPWLARANPLDSGALGGGALFGVGAHTTPAEMLRAVAAGMCYELERVLEAVAASGAVDGVVLGGGASRGRFFQAILATLFHPLPVWSPAEEDLSGARGAVFAFSRRAGRAAARRVALPTRALRERIAQGRQTYRRLYERLYGHVHAGEAFRLPGPGGVTK